MFFLNYPISDVTRIEVILSNPMSDIIIFDVILNIPINNAVRIEHRNLIYIECSLGVSSHIGC